MEIWTSKISLYIIKDFVSLQVLIYYHLIMENESNNNILSVIDNDPDRIMLSIAGRVKERRLEKNFTQNDLSLRSGIPLPTYRRFEQTGEISLRGLVMIAFALDSTDDFSTLFDKKGYNSIDEIINIDNIKKRKRGGRK